MFESLKSWFASLRRVNGVELPDGGRSSVDGTALSDRIAAQIGATGSFSPQIDFHMLRLLKLLWVTNPDLSQYVTNIVNLGNNGHSLTVDAKTDAIAEAAVNRLNESATRLYTSGAGVDGLFNAYLAQVAWSGAISSEDVVDFGGQRVKEVVLVPVEQIRFLYIDGEYVPHQRPGVLWGVDKLPLGLIRLNPQTYHYFASQTVENSPYAKPPASAAVSAITGPQHDMLENVKFIARKLGILGLVSVACTPPPRKPNETEAEYQSRAQKYLTSVRQALEPNFNKGLLITYRDQKIDHSNVAADARGAYDIFRLNEEQVMSGMAMQPAFFGRTDSTTETYADVVYQILVALVGNFQRLVKRRQEATYRLDLTLGGVLVDGVTLSFNAAHSRNPGKEAQAELIKTQNAVLKAQEGLISPDQAAQELGYESAFDPEMISAQPAVGSALQSVLQGAGHAQRRVITLRFDRAGQRYRPAPPRIELLSGVVENHFASNMVRLEKKTRKAA
jgi:hypothetical protein